MSDFFTDEYQQKLEEYHKQKEKWGSLGPRAMDVSIFLRDENPKTVLDYGCGKGFLKMILHDTYGKITNYDPGIPKFSNIPTTPHDVVICLDVLEHVEEQCLPAVFEHLRSLTKNKIFLYISCKPAINTFPDGQNVHITLKSPLKWIALLSKYFHLLEAKTKGINGGLFYIGRPKAPMVTDPKNTK